VLWITRTDTAGWKEAMDWFLRQPTARAAIVDTANRWEWFAEHEITLRIARGLFYGPDEERKLEAVCWLHDDMAPPTGNDWVNWIRAWRESKTSTAVVAQCFEMWGDFDAVRADALAPLDDAHCWFAKVRPDLRWLLPRDAPKKLPNEVWERFLPVDRADVWESPFGMRHYKVVDEAFRSGYGIQNQRRGWCQRWKDPQGNPRTVVYDPAMRWEEFAAKVKEAKP
jgi:hypothetical protein